MNIVTTIQSTHVGGIAVVFLVRRKQIATAALPLVPAFADNVYSMQLNTSMRKLEQLLIDWHKQ